MYLNQNAKAEHLIPFSSLTDKHGHTMQFITDTDSLHDRFKYGTLATTLMDARIMDGANRRDVEIEADCVRETVMIYYIGKNDKITLVMPVFYWTDNNFALVLGESMCVNETVFKT
jgi:hypothetical protein